MPRASDTPYRQQRERTLGQFIQHTNVRLGQMFFTRRPPDTPSSWGGADVVVSHGGDRYTYYYSDQMPIPAPDSTGRAMRVPRDFPLNPAADPVLSRSASQPPLGADLRESTESAESAGSPTPPPPPPPPPAAVPPESPELLPSLIHTHWSPDFGFRRLTRRARDQQGTQERERQRLATLEAEARRRPPPPVEESQKDKRLECKICFMQVANIACVPCGHVVMCSWCADQWCPSMASLESEPAYLCTCPMCRTTIQKKLKLILTE